MKNTQWKKLLAAAVLVQMAAPAAAVAANREDREESDDATARREATYHFYNEDYANHGKKRGGPWSVKFSQYMNKAAAEERAKYSNLMPGTATTIAPITSSTTLAATGTTWVNIGPTKADYIENGSSHLVKTDSGRINTIVPHPTDANTLYVAASGGGVWKTTNAGATWTPITDTLGSLSVGALTMDPANPNTLYLGLGDSFDGTGVGLVKSTDGGSTWFNTVYLGDSSMITDVMVSRTDSNVVFATTNKGLFRSVDAGASWSLVSLNTGIADTPYAWSIAYAGGTSYVISLEANPSATSGATSGQIWRTADNGATWTQATGVTVSGGMDRITVASAPSNRSVLYASAANSGGDLAEIFKSTNGGASWTALGAAAKRYKNGNTEARTVGQLYNTQGWYDQTIAIDPANPNLAYFGGALHLAKTTDGGTTWYQVSNWLAQFSLPYVHADFHASAIANGKIYVGTDGGIFVSADGGTTWSDTLNVGIASHLIYDVGSSGTNKDAVIIGLQDNGTRVRSGATSTFNQEIGGDGFDVDMHKYQANTMLGTLYYDRIYKSTDGGLNFSAASSGIAESNNSSTAPFTTQLTWYPGDATGNTLFTYANAKAYKTTNYAASWTALGVTGLPASGLYIRGLGVASNNANVIGLAANSGRVFLTNNGGASWTQATATPNNGLSMNDVQFDPTNNNIVYVTSVAPDGTKNHVWKSTDFGASWTVIENGLPAGVPVNRLAIDPGSSTTLYAATHLGVYRSTDSGATWTRFGAGMPLVNVTDIEILPDSSLVRAATFGRSVWELRP